MKNAFFTSLVVLLFTNGFVYSQGQPKSIKLTERTTIKDTLGNILKLSDCSEYINADGWIFQPEKNEQGKVLYVLLRKTTKAESELFSKTSVSAIKDKEIKTVKRGKFFLPTTEEGDLRIRRRRNKQIEYRTNSNGVTVKSKFRIVWSDDTSYALTPIGTDVENSNELRYKVVEISDDYYIARVIGENYLGETIKVFLNK
ncbi:MAG: hypothetical protein COA38_14765 [Fluviicola sp.]|nr:MAG: hypothetical protein COA38_14765 [Fluviicola sp.]